MNRLASEKSPYLLQHASNPVHWHPWGEEAFEAARRADKPIFLSIGYSTCHWCHVMAHESFEDPRVAAVLNEHFISVKVDREERPDVDRIYMTFVQATTGSGGWPMSVWLLPDLRPFYGGTYFPPGSAWGRPGFVDLLREMARLWRTERGRLETAAAGVVEHLAGAASQPGGAQVPGAIALDGATRDLLASYDRRHGGFGGAPKFPRPSELLFLLREHRRTGESAPLDATLHTLRAMAAGGMRDQVGGGFHRYSVDGQWRVPHFEKMLYDQAQLVLAYVEAAQASGDRFFLEVVKDTLRYVQRDLTAPDGGFYSAEDADSLPPESAGQASSLSGAVGQASSLSGAVGQASSLSGAVGQVSSLSGAVGQASSLSGAVGQASSLPHEHKSEGAFYLWTAAEIADLLGPDAQAFAACYGIAPDGNAPQDPHGEFTGRNILYRARSVDEVACELGQTREEVQAALSRSLDLLFRARAARPRPHLDDKVLTAWNGLMIAAFARASRVAAAFGEESGHAAGDLRPAAVSRSHGYLESAQRAATFIRQRMWDPSAGRLLRRYRDGEAAIDAYAEDFACLVFGLLELFQADGDPAWLEWAIELQHLQDARFLDAQAGGWFSTSGHDSSLLMRLKEDYDGAEPAVSSIAVLNLLVLLHLGAAPETASRTLERTLTLFAPRITRVPRAVPMMLSALSAWHAGMAEVVIAGPGGDEGTKALAHAMDRTYQPFAVVVRADTEIGHVPPLSALLPWLGGQGMRNGRPAAYVCRNFACERPVTAAAELAERLAGR
jgi:uncharacterized protein